MRQQALTVIAEIRDGEVEELRELLAKVQEQVNEELANLMEGKREELVCDKQTFIRFNQTPTHFARWVILDNDPQFPPMLVFSSNFDGKLDSYLQKLVAAGPRLDEIWGYCKGYPQQATSDPATFKRFIKDHSYRPSTFYIAYQGLTRDSVWNALDVREKIEQFLDQERATPDFAQLSPREVVDKINQFVRDSKIELLPGSMPRKNFLLSMFQKVYDFAWRSVAFSRLIRFVLGTVFLPVRLLEIPENARYQRTHRGNYIPSATALANEAGEDLLAQNQMTHIVPVKANWFRLVLLSVSLRVVNALGRYIFNQGALGDINTVQFARWTLIDNRKRLLFFSNFDGSWQNYMGDFVDRVPEYLTIIWTNTIRFPPTEFYYRKGAANLDGFMQFIREFQVPSNVWYTAYPRDTGRGIINAVGIRDKLGKRMSAKEQVEWLRRFGVAPAPGVVPPKGD